MHICFYMLTHRDIQKCRWFLLLQINGRGRDFMFEYTQVYIYAAIQYIFFFTQQGHQQQNQSQATNDHNYYSSDISIPNIQ